VYRIGVDTLGIERMELAVRRSGQGFLNKVFTPAELAVQVGEAQVHITASFGVAAFPEARTADELMTAADLALYSAKRQGKDRVVAVNPESQ
jgi:diguanylate cyclase (GGDEF)-like protein